MNRFKYLLMVLGATALIYLSCQTVTVLTVRLPRERYKAIEMLRVGIGTKIRLHYLHSVEHTQVEGVFSLGDDGKLHIQETRMTSVGTGLPNDAARRSHREKNWIVVDEKHKVIDDLNFYYVPVNHTRLSVGNREIPLSHIQPSTLIRLAIEHPRSYRWALWKTFKLDWYKEKDS